MKTTQCTSCGAPIIWAVTPKGKRMPVNETRPPRGEGNVTLGQRPGEAPIARVVVPGTGTHSSHFATCPFADLHRGRR